MSDDMQAIVSRIETLERAALACLLFALLPISGCDFQRNVRSENYNNALSWPLAGIRVYSQSYARNKALCNPKSAVGEFSCEEAKGDLATLRLDEQQALSIYEQMKNDSLLKDEDRADAVRYASQLRASLAEANP